MTERLLHDFERGTAREHLRRDRGQPMGHGAAGGRARDRALVAKPMPLAAS